MYPGILSLITILALLRVITKEISRSDERQLMISDTEDVTHNFTKHIDKRSEQTESDLSSEQVPSDDDDQQLIIQEIEDSLQKNTSELDGTNTVEIANNETPSTSPNDKPLTFSNDASLIYPNNKSPSSPTDKYKQAMKETFRLYEAMQLDKATEIQDEQLPGTNFGKNLSLLILLTIKS